MGTYTAPTDDDLRVITEELWSSYLDIDGDRPLMSASGADPVMGISAAVSVTGGWNGHVIVECSAAAAREATAAMLGIVAAEVGDADIADALGEMANVVGGSVKSLLPDDCALSLPHVVDSTSARRFWPAVTEICRFEASWIGEPVLVTVLESQAEVAKS
jgi:chemotaxis protein CheX